MKTNVENENFYCIHETSEYFFTLVSHFCMPIQGKSEVHSGDGIYTCVSI